MKLKWLTVPVVALVLCLILLAFQIGLLRLAVTAHREDSLLHWIEPIEPAGADVSEEVTTRPFDEADAINPAYGIRIGEDVEVTSVRGNTIEWVDIEDDVILGSSTGTARYLDLSGPPTGQWIECGTGRIYLTCDADSLIGREGE